MISGLARRIRVAVESHSPAQVSHAKLNCSEIFMKKTKLSEICSQNSRTHTYYFPWTLKQVRNGFIFSSLSKNKQTRAIFLPPCFLRGTYQAIKLGPESKVQPLAG
jgi:hypothetical protein